MGYPQHSIKMSHRLEIETGEEWRETWSGCTQGTLSDEKLECASQNGDIGDEWKADANTPWPQPDNSAINAWKEQYCCLWADVVRPQIQVNWDVETDEVLEPEPAEPTEAIMVDTLEKLDAFLPILSHLKDGVELAFDCEGTPEKKVNGEVVSGTGFGRNGNMSFLSMTIISMNQTYIFDVFKLQRMTFERTNEDGLSLKKVLESQDRIQLWWDVRGDWDTLFHVFGIRMGKVRDVQLMELLSRSGPKSNIYGLLRAMREEGNSFMKPEELENWLDDKKAGSDYFREHNWEPLITRPINETARSYIAGDTDCLFQLHNRLQDRLRLWASRLQGKSVGGLMELIGKRSKLLATIEDLMEFIDQESTRRAHYAISPGYDSKSPVGKTIPPAAFLRIADFWENNFERIQKRWAEGCRSVI
ncbi:hypothetical protein NHQ30_000747 [Ciborinia camelliae]|nr:hypothetical protein NHQ30_000747 [Ciborinia camelliae]